VKVAQLEIEFRYSSISDCAFPRNILSVEHIIARRVGLLGEFAQNRYFAQPRRPCLIDLDRSAVDAHDLVAEIQATRHRNQVECGEGVVNQVPSGRDLALADIFDKEYMP